MTEIEAPSRPAFAHPSEEEFARLLDYYGIAWEYEPTTFALARDDEGNVTRAFTPDFYLPQQDLYIELTTLRPHLHSRKHRKVRRLQQLYPDIRIKLMKRNDMRTLFLKYGLEEEARKLMGTDAQSESE
jgi:hypothetical protein